MAAKAKDRRRGWVTIKKGRKGKKHHFANPILEYSQTEEPKAPSSSLLTQMKILCSLPPPLSYFQLSLFMQHPKNDSNSSLRKMSAVKGMNYQAPTSSSSSSSSKVHDIHLISRCRKPWYQRAMEVATHWKSITKSTTAINNNNNNSSLWKSSTSPKSPYQVPAAATTPPSPNKTKLRKCTSLKVATSFTRGCLCAPIYSYTEVLRNEVPPPRRSYSYPTSSSSSSSKPLQNHHAQEKTPRLSIEGGGGRRVFRGKSLTDDVLMRRFVIEEEAMMQIRKRNEMEVIRKMNMIRRKRLGPSPLSRMVLAEDDHIGQLN